MFGGIFRRQKPGISQARLEEFFSQWFPMQEASEANKARVDKALSSSKALTFTIHKQTFMHGGPPRVWEEHQPLLIGYLVGMTTNMADCIGEHDAVVPLFISMSSMCGLLDKRWDEEQFVQAWYRMSSTKPASGELLDGIQAGIDDFTALMNGRPGCGLLRLLPDMA